ncbi:MAG TPA: sugar-binding protein [Candidatus Sulfotelmatobacter sp.]|nr:sugar-binding protein [Candidatus Sulfotelmatobacter sp.]
MTSPKWLSVGPCSLVVGTLFLLLPSGAASQAASPRNSIPGKQLMVAHYSNTPPVIDGVFTPGEWAAATPVFVEGSSSPATPPGVVPSIGLPYLFPPDSPADSSFTVYTLYDANNLYVAVDVTDDIVICDGPVAYLDDDAEIMIDGDRQPGDIQMAFACGPSNPNCPNPVVNNEGFQLVTSVQPEFDISAEQSGDRVGIKGRIASAWFRRRVSRTAQFHQHPRHKLVQQRISALWFPPPSAR